MAAVPPSTRAAIGLSSAQAREKLAEVGPNALPEPKPESFWLRVVRQFQNALIYLLLGALIFDIAIWIYEGAHSVPLEGLAIVAVLVLNAGLGVAQEYRSERALSELAALASPRVWVLRDGVMGQLSSRELVPGDVVRLDAGDRVPADGTLCSDASLTVDESVLTGESLPVEKAKGEELSSGSLIVRGQGLFAVLRTGPASTMGRLAGALIGIEAGKTPLERRIDALGTAVARVVFALTAAMILFGVLHGPWSALPRVVLFSVAFAVAIVPEGMPAVIALALALGVERMARRSAIVRRLSAVEALGSVTVIATDKTGTLTENRLRVCELSLQNDDEALRAMVLANAADFPVEAGDPLELALLEYASGRGLDIPSVRAESPVLSSRPFDSGWKFMRVSVERAGATESYLKGAFEVILARARLADAEREAHVAWALEQAGRGLRVLALARSTGEREDDLEFLGLVAFRDPPRPEVPAALEQARQAGIRVMLLTGDHPETARSIAQELGLLHGSVVTGVELEGLSPEALSALVAEHSVFSRVRPEHKLQIVEALKARGEIVAMTGDGVNDAPALKRADVGIAMGQRGSDVAREVSDIVLADDNFATIVTAVDAGRVIFENIVKFIRFTFSTNVALLLLVAGGALGSLVLGLQGPFGQLLLPVTAVQILWINFLGDGPPALALALDKSANALCRPPRPPNSALLDRDSLTFIATLGAVKGGLGLGLLALLPGLGESLLATQTSVFTYEALAKLISVYPSRRVSSRAERNLSLHAAVVAGVALQVAALSIPALREVLTLEIPSMHAALLVVGAIGVTWAFGEGLALRLQRATK